MPIPTKLTLVTESMQFIDVGGIPIIHYFKNAIPTTLCRVLFQSIEELKVRLKPDRPDRTQKIDELYHFGFWRFYTQDIRPAKKTTDKNALRWVTANEALFARMAAIVGRFYPGLQLKIQQLPEEKVMFKLWTIIAINLNAPSHLHVDKKILKVGTVW